MLVIATVSVVLLVNLLVLLSNLHRLKRPSSTTQARVPLGTEYKHYVYLSDYRNAKVTNKNHSSTLITTHAYIYKPATLTR